MTSTGDDGPDAYAAAIRKRAVLLDRGKYFDDFAVGQKLEHHWGRTLTQADNVLFNSLTLNYNPLYQNLDQARAQGHPSELINPHLVFLVVFGLSVEDLSEKGGAFLGVQDLAFRRDAYPGDTVYASSTVTSLRPSESRPDMGIATWHTTGTSVDGDLFVEFWRTNLIPRSPAVATATSAAPGGAA
jgi:itaconyl-CoA hydratase